MEQDVVLELGQCAEGARTANGAAEPPGVLDELSDKIEQAAGVSEVAVGKGTPSGRTVNPAEYARLPALGGASGIVCEAKVRFGLRVGAACSAGPGFGLAAIWHAPPCVLQVMTCGYQ